MYKLKKNPFFIVLIAWLLVSCAPENMPVKETRVIILHTNDEHARIDNMARLAFLKDSLAKTCDYVLLVSAGDHFSGNPYVDMYPERGFPMIDLMNKAGYQISALGNHEFDFGQETMNKRLSEATFPIVCANTNFDSTVVRSIKPYEILKVGDLNFAFLGLIELNNRQIPSTAPANTIGCKFRQGIDVAAEYMTLRKDADLFVCLSHLGIEVDTILARKYSDFDLIIGGHSHTLIDSTLIVNGTQIVQAGAYLKYVGKISLLFRNDSLVEQTYEIIPLASVTGENAAIAELIKKYSTNPEFDVEIAKLEIPLSGKNEIGNLYTDAIRSELKLDVVLQNNGAIRKSNFEVGSIRMADIHTLDPFSNDVILFQLTAAEIKSLIAFSYNMNNDIDLQISGMTYRIKTDKDGKLKGVDLLTEKGKPVAENKKFNTGISNYISEVYSFDHAEEGVPSGFTTTELLIRHLKKIKVVKSKSAERIKIQ